MHKTIWEQHADFVREMRKNMLNSTVPDTNSISTDSDDLEDLFPLDEEDIRTAKSFSGNSDSDGGSWDEELQAELEKNFKLLFG